MKTRGIAFGKGETLLDLYRERLPYYEKYADITVDCRGATAEQNIENIIEALKDKGQIQ